MLPVYKTKAFRDKTSMPQNITKFPHSTCHHIERTLSYTQTHTHKQNDREKDRELWVCVSFSVLVHLPKIISFDRIMEKTIKINIFIRAHLLWILFNKNKSYTIQYSHIILDNYTSFNLRQTGEEKGYNQVK